MLYWPLRGHAWKCSIFFYFVGCQLIRELGVKQTYNNIEYIFDCPMLKILALMSMFTVPLVCWLAFVAYTGSHYWLLKRWGESSLKKLSWVIFFLLNHEVRKKINRTNLSYKNMSIFKNIFIQIKCKCVFSFLDLFSKKLYPFLSEKKLSFILWRYSLRIKFWAKYLPDIIE